MFTVEWLAVNDSIVSSKVFREGTYTIGRKDDCDISFPNDRSVSRNHAALRISNNEAILNDVGSTFGSTANGNQCPKGSNHVVQPSTILKFGNENSRLRITPFKLAFCPTRLTKQDKEELRIFCEKVGGTIVAEIEPCTHVICHQFCATMKTVLAIALKKKLVTFEWIRALTDKEKKIFNLPSVDR